MRVLTNRSAYLAVIFIFSITLLNTTHPLQNGSYSALAGGGDATSTGTILSDNFLLNAGQWDPGERIPIYYAEETGTITLSLSEAAAMSRNKPIQTFYGLNAPLDGTVALIRLKDRTGNSYYAIGESIIRIFTNRYGIKPYEQVGYVYPPSAKRAGMFCPDINYYSYPDLSFSFCVWETKEDSRAATTSRSLSTVTTRPPGTRRSLSEIARTRPEPTPTPTPDPWIRTPEPVYASNDCGHPTCNDVVRSAWVQIPDGSAYVRHEIERTTENPRGDNNGKWRICHGLIPGPDGRIKGVWIEVRAGSKNTHGPRVWIGANLKVLTRPGQASPACEGCSSRVGCNKDTPSPLPSSCQAEGTGRVFTFQDGGTGTSISEMSVTNASTGMVSSKEWANTTSGSQNAIHFTVTCQEAGVRCCLNGNTVYMYGRHGFDIKGLLVSWKNF